METEKALTDIDRKKEIFEQKFIKEVNRIAEDLKETNMQLNEDQIKAEFAKTWEKVIGSLEKTEKKKYTATEFRYGKHAIPIYW